MSNKYRHREQILLLICLEIIKRNEQPTVVECAKLVASGSDIEDEDHQRIITCIHGCIRESWSFDDTIKYITLTQKIGAPIDLALATSDEEFLELLDDTRKILNKYKSYFEL